MFVQLINVILNASALPSRRQPFALNEGTEASPTSHKLSVRQAQVGEAPPAAANTNP